MAKLAKCLAIAAALLAGQDARSAIDLRQQLFVANHGSRDIVILDTESLTIDGSVALDHQADQYVLSAEHRRLIATNRDARTLTFVDLESRDTLRVEHLSMRPDQIELDDGAGLVAIGDFAARAIRLFDLTDGSERLALLDLPVSQTFMFDRDGERLMVGGPQSNELLFIDIATGVVTQEIELSSPTVELARTPGGLTALALHGDNGMVSMIDLKTTTLLSTIQLQGPAIEAYPTANSQYFMVPSTNDATLSMLSVWTGAESERLPAAENVAGVNAGLFDTVAALLDRKENRVRLLDLREYTIADEIDLGATPETAAVDADGVRLFVALPERHAIAVIDLREQRLVSVIENVGNSPWGVSLAGGLSYCH